jgi:hypothetical protein
MDVWLELLGWALPEIGTFSFGPFSALMMGGNVGNTGSADTAR